MSAPLFFADAQAFRAWLAANAATADALLVGYHKVGSGQASMSWPDSVDEALCVGWIDGRRNRLCDSAYSIRFSPRKPGSIWSTVNIDKVARLRAQGRMTAAGEQAFALRTAARSGIYSHEQAHTAQLTPQEVSLFEQDGPGWQFFQATPPSYKKRLLHWVTSAKKDATRATRLDKLRLACAQGLRLD